VVSVVGVPVLCVEVIKGKYAVKSVGMTVLGYVVFVLLVPVLAPMLYVFMFFYLVSFCGWAPFLERKIQKNAT